MSCRRSSVGCSSPPACFRSAGPMSASETPSRCCIEARSKRELIASTSSTSTTAADSGMKYATRETNATRAVIHSGAAVATLLQRNQKKTISVVDPQKMETTVLSSASKYDIITVMSARYARRWRRAPARQRRGQPGFGTRPAEAACCCAERAQLLHGYGAALRTPRPAERRSLAAGPQRSSGTASNVDGAAVGASASMAPRSIDDAIALLLVRTGPDTPWQLWAAPARGPRSTTVFSTTSSSTEPALLITCSSSHPTVSAPLAGHTDERCRPHDHDARRIKHMPYAITRYPPPVASSCVIFPSSSSLWSFISIPINFPGSCCQRRSTIGSSRALRPRRPAPGATVHHLKLRLLGRALGLAALLGRRPIDLPGASSTSSAAP